ncbi:MAG: nucleoside-diphosphate-sugar pyrophosphorylase [Methanobacterium sp.]|nr:MAG: nucleoside-diphosphate-sugar pyrophosphorylase [Methanobacterium sp.]
MKAVILAGGKGTRLKPYTTVFPKPLMPIGDKPVLEIVIGQLKSYGFDEIILAVGHLAELIKAFFNDGSKYNAKITYFREDEPLGTAGPLFRMKKELNENFLMMNGDVITTLDFSNLLIKHNESGAIATVALKKKDVNIDFGVVELSESNEIIEYSEKPKFNYLVSMGVYVFSPNVLKYISDDEYLDFPDLIKKLIKNGETVNGYIYDGYWLDIGRPEDYDKANLELDKISEKLFKR